MLLHRRDVLAGSAAALAFSGFAARAHAQDGAAARSLIQADTYQSQVLGYGPLVRDPAGVFDLPAGFSYAVLSREGERMDDGLRAPGKFDGMGCFDLGGGQVALVRNHEIRPRDEANSAFAAGSRVRLPREAYYDRLADGRPMGGGTVTLVYDVERGRVRSRRLSLAGTRTNCAGGSTPWGSWLTCEETVEVAGESGERDHGWVFEVPAAQRGLAAPEPIRGLGRFKHEAVAIDPRTGVVYLTEDEADGLFYRFLPDDRRNLHAGGRLQALAFRGAPGADTTNWNDATWAPGQWNDAVWIDLEDTANPGGDLKLRGAQAGAAIFARGEGVYAGVGEIYFTCTSGGPERLGQIMRYQPSPFEGGASEASDPGRLQLFSQPTAASVMRMPDNLAVAPWGHLIVCEDRSDGVNYLRGVTPDGAIYTLGRSPAPMADEPTGTSELAGACFSPDGSTMFLNIFSPGVTLAITGPWGNFSH